MTARHSNKMSLELDMLLRENEVGTLRFMIAGGDLENHPGKLLISLSDNPQLIKIFKKWTDQSEEYILQRKVEKSGSMKK